MAPLSFHTMALKPMIFGLKNAHAFISKAYTHTQTAGLDPDVYLSARLRPDMYNFTKQVRFFTKEAILLPTHINPEHKGPDVQEEITGFPELLDYITEAIEYLENLKPEVLNGREDTSVLLKLGNDTVEVEYNGLEFVTMFAHPNFWFHVTTAYDILRHEGLDVGKVDYINGAGLRTFKYVGGKS